MRTLSLMLFLILALPSVALAERSHDVSVRVDAWRRGGPAPVVDVRAAAVDADGARLGDAVEGSGEAGDVILLGRLPEGRVVVDAVAAGFEPARATTEVLGDTEFLLELWPAAPVLVDGTVHTLAGEPIEGARVALRPRPPRVAASTLLARTDAAGTFEMGPLAACFTDVVVEADGYETLTISGVEALADTSLVLALEPSGGGAEVESVSGGCAHAARAPNALWCVLLIGLACLRRRRC